jgi:hypothetical protein
MTKRLPFALPFAWRSRVRLAWSGRLPAANSQTTPWFIRETDS